MVDMLSRPRYEDEDGMVSEDEEVGEAENGKTKRSTRERFQRRWLQRGVAPDRKISEDDDNGRCDDKRRGRTAPKEGVPVLSTRGKNLEGPKKEKRRPTPSGSEHQRPTKTDLGVPREPLVRTSRYVGYLREIKGEILVARLVQKRARLRVYVRELSDALGGPTPRRPAPDLPSDRALQMDGRPCHNANGRRAEEVSGTGKGGLDQSGRGTSVN